MIFRMFIHKIFLPIQRTPRHLNSLRAALLHLTPIRLRKHKDNYWDQEEAILRTKTSIDIVKSSEKDEEQCLYPILKRLGISTTERNHHFDVSCDSTIKFIKLGAINKNIALQYCHYLAEVCRSSSDIDFSFYSKRVFDLMLYLIRQCEDSKDITDKMRAMLLCDVSDISSSHCSIICDQILDQFKLNGRLGPRDMSRLLSCCYKHGLWGTATKVMIANNSFNIVNPQLIDPLVEGTLVASAKYRSLKKEEEKNDLRSQYIDHLLNVLEISYRDRVQFITKQPSEFAQALEDLGIRNFRNPTIKMSGRCTRCNSHLHMYNDKDTRQLNQSIQSLINLGESGLRLNASQEESERFLKFLDALYQKDKKPIDVVIDGLNLSYRNTMGYNFHKQSITDDYQRTVRRHSVSSLTQVLVNTILRNDMLRRFKKIVVIGRTHMQNWPGLIDFFKKNNVYFFPSGEKSQDDLFQLYAATLNPKTILITNDFLRDHLANLELESRVLLERWIDTHQAWILNKNLKAIWPTPFEKMPTIDRENRRFHLPVINYNLLDTIALHEPPPHLNSKMVTWLCCEYGDKPIEEGKEILPSDQ